MERSRISSRDLRHFPEWCTGWCWWRWSGSVTMTAAGWSRSCLDDFPSDDIHSHTALLLLGCTSSIFSSPSKLPVFGTQPEEVAWKDVGKYHPCIHKSRKSWSNKSFESLLHHVCMADILQNKFPCSFLFAFFPSLYFTPSVGVHQCLSGAERSCASLGQETHRRRTLYPNIFSVQQDRGHQVNANPLTRTWSRTWQVLARLMLTSCQWRAPCGQLVMIEDQQSSCISTLLLMKRSSMPHRAKYLTELQKAKLTNF